MERGEPDKQALAFFVQTYLHLPTISLARPSKHEPASFTARNQGHHAVRFGLQALSQFAHCGEFAPGISLDMQKQQILKRSHAVGASGALRKTLKSAHLIAKLGQLLERRLRQGRIAGPNHGISVQIQGLNYIMM
jgi:hypothetical protein